MKNKNILYLVKMGCDYTEESDVEMIGSDIGNYRIRGTFHDKNNDLIFIEFGNGYERNSKGITTSKIKLRVDHQFNKTKSDDENESHIKIDYEKLKKYNYTKKDILKYINRKFGVKFDKLELIDTTITNYNYNLIPGDDFKPNLEEIKQAKKIKEYFYKFEKEKLGKKYPNFSTYYEENNFKVLLHYNCYNDVLTIKDLFKFDFNYKVPTEEIKKAERNYYSKYHI